MTQEAIFYPAAALVLLTLLVMALIPYKRFKAAFAREVNAGDFRYGESARVPGHVSLPNRNYMNLLELPMLFYVVCVIFYVTKTVDAAVVYLAWAYFALRVGHTAVHITYNNVIHRLGFFASSCVVLAVMWVLVIAKI
jgi:hypothetical protein